jgi:kynurenine 3-monooxygenase
VSFHFQCGVEAIDFEHNQIRVKNERSGEITAHHFDLLIGADGGGSVVRKAVDAFHSVNSVEEKLFHSYKELHIGASPQGQFQLDGESLHIWPRGDYMLIGLPNPDKSFTMTLFLPDQGHCSFAELKSRSDFLPFAQQQFADALALMPNAGELFEQNPTGFLGTVHCPRWTVPNKALLIGDAAHAVVPFHGQGMNCGFEDCAELAALLAQHDDDWSRVMPAYQDARLPNAEAIALMAQENYVEMRATSADPKFQLKKSVGFLLEQRFKQFIPRYSMVMFHHLPYAEALRRGRLNEIVLDSLCATIDRPEQIDWSLAEQLVQQHLG